MGSAGRRLTQQRVAGGALPALVAPTASVHAVSVSAAVCRPAAPRVNAEDGGDTASTAPPVVQITVRGARTSERQKKKKKEAGCMLAPLFMAHQ